MAKEKKNLSATYRSLQQLVVVLAGASDDVGSFGTDALETTTFAPRRVVWVSADIISIYSCAYKSKVKLSLSHS